MSNIIPDKIFSDDELLELMGDLVGIKENIEALEIIYLEESANDY
jgi:hypothetical protein